MRETCSSSNYCHGNLYKAIVQKANSPGFLETPKVLEVVEGNMSGNPDVWGQRAWRLCHHGPHHDFPSFSFQPSLAVHGIARNHSNLSQNGTCGSILISLLARAGCQNLSFIHRPFNITIEQPSKVVSEVIGVPSVIIQLLVRSSISNHPAIGVSPSMEPPFKAMN